LCILEKESDLHPLLFGINYFGKREDKLVKDKDSIPALIDGRWDEEIQLRKAVESLSEKVMIGF
jgi:hypothetical protein